METSGPFERVLAAARRGEGWALAELFRDLHPRVLRYLATVAPDDADDLTSDTWLDVVRALDRFRGSEADLRALAFSIARTRLAETRDAQARQLLERDGVAEVVPPTMAREHLPKDFEPALGGLDTEQALARILSLPLEEAEVILLRVLGGLSAHEVARTLERSPREVRSLQQRGLTELARITSQERSAR